MAEKTPGEIKVEQFKTTMRYGKSEHSCSSCASYITIPSSGKQLSKCKQIGIFETDKSDVSASGNCASWHQQ